FRQHYAAKAKKAKRIAGAIRGVELLTGPLPVKYGTKLYMALVDPHLTHGADVLLDTVDAALRELEKVQLLYIRRMLGLNGRSRTFVLFTETGLLPLRSRRLSLAIRFVLYVLRSPGLLVSSAYREMVSLDFAGHRTWVGQLREAVRKLPYACAMPDHNGLLSVERMEELLHDVVSGVGPWLQGLVDASPRLSLIHGRCEPDATGELTARVPMALRQYLRVANPGPRRALTRVLLSEHKYATRMLRWTHPGARCLCRFCGTESETVEHLWLWCRGSDSLSVARRRFMVNIWKSASVAERADLESKNDDAPTQLKALLSGRKWVAIAAEFAYDIERLVEKVPVRI
ncbi:hypothetical protein DFP72DRAFT_814897, partial [Ephemerocybe angulata]